MLERDAIAAELETLGSGPIRKIASVAGGDISPAWRVDCDTVSFFVKTGPADADELFSAEADGLAELRRPGCLRVPSVVARGSTGDSAFLILEWLDLGAATNAIDALLGERLAMLHQATADRHGWFRDNYIGRTPQPNKESASWIDFFATQRLEHQLRLADGADPALSSLGARLIDRLPAFFDEPPEPSLLHGDLWSGNRAGNGDEPVIFDPAVYYGDSETDLAMTRLFGGFGRSFYSAYESLRPLRDGWQRRSELYQLYHVLNHLNLFGGGYLGRSLSLMKSLLK